MRVLLDENLPRRLKRSFDEGVEVMTVREKGWQGRKNGELLGIAQVEFDIFITTDKGIPHQQNLSLYSIAIILLEVKSNRFEELLPLLPKIQGTLQSIQAGQLVRISF